MNAKFIIAGIVALKNRKQLKHLVHHLKCMPQTNPQTVEMNIVHESFIARCLIFLKLKR